MKEEQEAAARAEAARAAQAAQAAQAVQSADDDSWYLDCEICGLAGWNYVRRLSLLVFCGVRSLTFPLALLRLCPLSSLSRHRLFSPPHLPPPQDDGQGLICCDQCEDWQHLPCHMHADELAGRPPQPYSDESFKWICGHCRGTCHRRPRPPKPAPGAPPTIAYARVDPSASHKRKGSHSSGSVAAKKVKVGLVFMNPLGFSNPLTLSCTLARSPPLTAATLNPLLPHPHPLQLLNQHSHNRPCRTSSSRPPSRQIRP